MFYYSLTVFNYLGNVYFVVPLIPFGNFLMLCYEIVVLNHVILKQYNSGYTVLNLGFI